MKREAFDVGIGRAVPFGLVPAAADDPLAGLGFGGGAGHLGDDIVPGAGFAEVEAEAEFADAGEVAVSFDEAGGGEVAVEVDDFGGGADPAGGVGVAAEGGDAAAADGEGLDDGLGGVHGDDLAVAQDQVGGLRADGGGQGGEGGERGETHGA